MIFSGLLTFYIVVEVILAFCPNPLGAGCSDDPNEMGWHEKSIMWVDTVEAALIILLAILLLIYSQKETKRIKSMQNTDIKSFKSKQLQQFRK